MCLAHSGGIQRSLYLLLAIIVNGLKKGPLALAHAHDQTRRGYESQSVTFARVVGEFRVCMIQMVIKSSMCCVSRLSACQARLHPVLIRDLYLTTKRSRFWFRFVIPAQDQRKLFHA